MKQINLILFEGLDGCGKTTQLELLKKYLLDKKEYVISTKEPTNNEIGLLIRKVLQKDIEMDKTALALLFIADRYEHQEHLSEITNEKTIILCDRGEPSNLAYQFAEGIDPEFIINCSEYIQKPNIIFYIRTDVDVCFKRLKERGTKIEMFETKEHMKKVAEGFDLIFSANSKAFDMCFNRYKHIYIIDGNRPIDEIHNEIVKKYEEYIQHQKAK